MLRRFPILKLLKGKNGLNFSSSSSSSSQNNTTTEFLAEGETIDGYFRFPRDTLTKHERSELLNTMTGIKKGAQRYRESATTPVYKESDSALKNFLSKHQTSLVTEKGVPKKVTLVSPSEKKNFLQEKLVEISKDELHRKGETFKDSQSIKGKIRLAEKLKKKSSLISSLKPFEKKYDTINSIKNSPTFNYFEEFVKKEEKIIKNSNYVIQNYNHGEEGIDYMPMNPRTQAEFNRQAFVFKIQLEDVIRGFFGEKHSTFFEKKMKWREQINNEFDEVYEAEVKEYPGSRKGPLPEDDPKEFADWYLKNTPKYMLEEIENAKILEESIDGKERSLPTIEMDQTALLSDSMLNEDLLNPDQDDSLAFSNSDLALKSNVEDWEITPYPDKVAPDWHHSADYFERWAIFRTFPYLSKFTKFLSKFIDDQEKGIYSYVPPRPSGLYTLFRYYNTLPEFARESPIVKNVLRNLEYTKHDITLKEKETILNYACLFALPLNEYMTDVLKDAVLAQYKYFVSAEEEMILLKDYKDEEDEEDVRGMIGEANHDQLELQKGQSQTDLNMIGEWNRPPVYDPLKSEEDPIPNLPLEFYDNDDGFWDNYIREKEEIAAAFPMIHKRPYFKH